MHLSQRLHALHRIWRTRLHAERREIAHMLRTDLDGATVVDAGAHRGVWCYWMHKAVGPAGRVVGFEPQPELAQYLRDLKSTFQLSQLTIVQAGLSSQTGENKLVRPAHWGAASIHLEPDENSEVLPIKTVKLDDYFRNSVEDLRPLRLIKADIQGHEYHCFVGAKKLLSEDRPEIICESEDHELPRLRLFLESIGYSGFFFMKNRLTPLAELEALRSTIDAPFLNYIFQPCERAASLPLRLAA